MPSFQFTGLGLLSLATSLWDFEALGSGEIPRIGALVLAEIA
jgi:hypothetical protein